MSTLCAGCGAVSSDTTLQELLTTSGLGSVTVGDVLGAIQNFSGNSGLLPFGGGLTADQQAQLSDLQSQLTAGTITQSDFETQARAIVGIQDLAGPFGAG